MTDKMRAEFEEWLQNSGRYSCMPYNLVKEGIEDDYSIWQASRAALIVELPCWSEYDTPRQAIEACADRIKDSGVKHNDE